MIVVVLRRWWWWRRQRRQALGMVAKTKHSPAAPGPHRSRAWQSRDFVPHAHPYRCETSGSIPSSMVGRGVAGCWRGPLVAGGRRRGRWQRKWVCPGCGDFAARPHPLKVAEVVVGDTPHSVQSAFEFGFHGRRGLSQDSRGSVRAATTAINGCLLRGLPAAGGTVGHFGALRGGGAHRRSAVGRAHLQPVETSADIAEYWWGGGGGGGAGGGGSGGGCGGSGGGGCGGGVGGGGGLFVSRSSSDCGRWQWCSAGFA